MVDTDEERTPLQQKLDEFAQQLSKVLWPDISFQILQWSGCLQLRLCIC